MCFPSVNYHRPLKDRSYDSSLILFHTFTSITIFVKLDNRVTPVKTNVILSTYKVSTLLVWFICTTNPNYQVRIGRYQYNRVRCQNKEIVQAVSLYTKRIRQTGSVTIMVRPVRYSTLITNASQTVYSLLTVDCSTDYY